VDRRQPAQASTSTRTTSMFSTAPARQPQSGRMGWGLADRTL
jgi:hypothetical protein